MSDPTTPVDVIAREIDSWLEWGGERQAATAIITALSEAGWEIVCADDIYGHEHTLCDALPWIDDPYASETVFSAVEWLRELADLEPIADREEVGALKRAAPEPDAPEITDEMIRSGLMAHIRSLRNTPEGQAIVRGVRPPRDEDDEPGGMHYEAMRAALTAALKARG